MKSQFKQFPPRKLRVVLFGLILAVQPVLAGPVVHVGQPCHKANCPGLDQVDHGSYDALLKKYVDHKGLVAYAKWKASAADLKALDAYLAKLGCVDLAKPASKASRLAFWINAYNAVTLHGILREYPTTSILNHASKSGGYNIWKDLRLWVEAKTYSLDEIEHDILRKLGEPRIHFALVCASKGCAPLASHAFTATNLEKTLAANARYFFAQPQNFKVNAAAKTVYVSQLLQWFGKDFAPTSQQQILWLRPYLPENLDLAWLNQGDFTVQFLPYDWSLNDQSPTGNK
jgi:hypothetical protein